VLQHGLLRDAQGLKMSKSLNNGVDPREMIDNYGCDALRFSLAMGVAPGSDVRMSEEKLESFRNFANKIWNASRFVLMNLDGAPEPLARIDAARLDLSDRFILTRCAECVEAITNSLENYDLGMAAQRIYDFAWSNFCDWYIETSKARLNGEDAAAKAAVRAVLYHVLLNILKLLHPFMPFITDAVYRHLPDAEGSIMVSEWPTADERFRFPDDARAMEAVMEIIRGVRNLRAEMNVSPGRRATLILRPRAAHAETLRAAESYFKRLAFAGSVAFLAAGDAAPEKAASIVTSACEAFLPLSELIDTDKEIARLEKDRAQTAREIQRAEGMLQNEGFLKKAPEALVAAEREKLAKNKVMLDDLTERIASLRA
jgi:valyl-tRNA synthetase